MRSKNLFADRADAGGITLFIDKRCHEITAGLIQLGGTASFDKHFRPFVDRQLIVLSDLFDGPLIDERSGETRSIERIAEFDASRPIAEPRRELVEHLLVNKDSSGRDAALTGRLEGA